MKRIQVNLPDEPVQISVEHIPRIGESFSVEGVLYRALDVQATEAPTYSEPVAIITPGAAEVVLTEADALADLAGTPRPDNSTVPLAVSETA